MSTTLQGRAVASGMLQGMPQGMQRIALPFETYEHASAPLVSKRLLNLFAEQQPQDARAPAALLSSPGLIPVMEVGAGPIRAINSDNPGAMYIASGDRFYRFGVIAGEPEDLGPIGVPTATWPRDALTTIAVGPNAAVVCVPPNAYTCSHSGALNQIGGDFPGASSVAYLDGYFVFTAVWSTLSEGAKFFCTGLLDPANFNALDFAFADGEPNVLQRVIAHRGELWFLGGSAIEVWYDAGAGDFPFRRQSGGLIHNIGSATPKTVVTADSSVFWTGMADDVVYRSKGYLPARISTNAIERIIDAQGGASAATGAVAYSQNGHIFYCLTVGSRTLCYDCATQLWHERSSSSDGTQPWRITAVGYQGVGNIANLGDGLSGKIFAPSLLSGREEHAALIRQFVTGPLWAGTRRAFCARVEIEMEVGGEISPGQVLLEWSDDGGHRWSAPRVMSAGLVNQYRQRVYTTRLGSFRQRVFRVTMQGHATIYAMDADIAQGAN